ncbi:alpha/beta fold hydrolase [Micromonospora maritima]|uniref:Alpha/beta fold hydrolase n=1 Tax=Micromonospora maritima TaxID=986711 RepID=A0ABW7ZGS4_9ACTN
MRDFVIEALTELVPVRVSRQELLRGSRRLRWAEAGVGRPTIVLVAGCGETALDWASIMPKSAECSRVVAYDRAGLGESEPAVPLTIETQVEDLAALLDEVGPAVVVGHSWGGLLAQLVALNCPHRIAGLVLIDPSHEELETWWATAAEVAMATGVVSLKSVGLFGKVARGMGRSLAMRCTDDDRLRGLIADAYVASYSSRQQVRMIRTEALLAARSAPFAREARGTSAMPDVPVVVLSAGRGKPRSLQERSAPLMREIAASTPRGRHSIVDDAGHYIHHDRPEVVIEAIADVVAVIRAESE